MKQATIFLLFILFFVSNSSFGQDTLDLQNEQEIDTVVIYKDPVVLRQTVFVKVKPREKELWLEITASPFYTINHYKPCPGYEAYLAELNALTKNSSGYYIGANFLFFYNNFLLSAGMGYSIFREKFTIASPVQGLAVTNTYSYLTVPLTAGYRIVNRQKLQLVLSAGMAVGKLTSVKGMTIAEENTSLVKSINEVRKYYSYNYQGVLKAKLVFPVKNKMYLGVEPYYMKGIGYVTKSLEPFTQTRDVLGLNGNLIFVF